ncbi:MBL fold metallo-hydrolase [Chitinophaga vietnamensis]|uniref:MBL fold metallo-hydrolase n=1 Tax=Chitinophaga vietnamensis TaxID=2593957 RepID=UPI0011775D7B|nr:MBL fold metallo-hydrolase [Chitinophaga vietnamensis]
MLRIVSNYTTQSRRERQQRINNSRNFRHNRFQNLIPTDTYIKGTNFFSLIYLYLKKHQSRKPAYPILRVREDLATHGHHDPEITWFGHSSYLISVNGRHVLVDPVFSNNLFFFPLLRIREFAGTDSINIDDLPSIDVVIITHDHQDHLDLNTIKRLAKSGPSFYMPLGVGAYLERLKIPPGRIIELDWWEKAVHSPEIKLTATPARHNSGRGLTNNKTLWASFVLEIHGYKIFVGGDSGYANHFKEIGKQFGSFDLAALECGQYGNNWPDIHMSPEQMAMAAADLKSKILLPVHWGRFSLALHPWQEPILRLEKALQYTVIKILHPVIGKRTPISGQLPTNKWWLQADQSKQAL